VRDRDRDPDDDRAERAGPCQPVAMSTATTTMAASTTPIRRGSFSVIQLVTDAFQSNTVLAGPPRGAVGDW
jgi:hypothetical protein